MWFDLCLDDNSMSKNKHNTELREEYFFDTTTQKRRNATASDKKWPHIVFGCLWLCKVFLYHMRVLIPTYQKYQWSQPTKISFSCRRLDEMNQLGFLFSGCWQYFASEIDRNRDKRIQVWLAWKSGSHSHLFHSRKQNYMFCHFWAADEWGWSTYP